MKTNKLTISLSICLGLTSVFSSCDKTEKNTIENILTNTEWKIDYLFCYDETIERYSMSVKSDTLEFNWGNFVLFSNNGTFKSYYTAWCGNDCFRTVYGKYKIISETTLSAKVDSATFQGWCTNSYSDSTWTEYRNSNPISFSISKDANDITLTLQSN